MKHRKNIALLLTGVLLGAALAGPAVGAVTEKLSAERSPQEVYVDGTPVTLEAYLINGNNYVQLRDMGKKLDFNVYWDGAVQISSRGPYTGEVPAAPTGKPQNPEAKRTEAEAKEIALADAGLKADAVSFLRVETGRENGTPVYEIEFYSGTTEYDYDIDMVTGEIVSRSQETKAITPGETIPPRADTGDAGRESAINTALTHAGLTRETVSRLQAKLDRENGRQVYEVEFHVGQTEYSYKVDAASYEIINWEKDFDD